MPGEYALVPLMEKAKDLARITGRKVEDIYEILVRQAQENMPDYSMIAPAGVGDLPSLPEGAGSNFPETFQSGRDVNDQLASPPSGSLPSGTNFLSSIAEGMRQTPFGKYSRAAEQGIMDVYEEDGLAAAIGETGRAGLGGLLSLGETAVEGYKPAAKALGYLARGPARALDQFLTGSTSADPLGSLGRSLGSSLYDIFEGSANENQALTDEAGMDPAKSDVPALTEAIVTAQQLTNDASKKTDGVGLLYDDDGFLGMPSGTGSREVQGTSGRQAQGTPDKTEPSLDFADLIAESKKAGMANALMQLGAGIAGGDLSKGISAAGIAATKGQQDAKAIAMRQRLAEYQAGREDIAREEKSLQFKKQMEILESRYDNELAKAASVGRNELFRTVTALVETAMEGSSEFDPAKREAMVQAMMKKYLAAYAPAFDVDPEAVSLGMREDQGARTPEQIKAIYGV
jgi:hypothetical protein